MDSIENKMQLGISFDGNGKGIQCFKSLDFQTLFRTNASKVAADLELDEGARLYVVELIIGDNIPTEKNKFTNAQNAYIIKKELDIFSILILGYWTLISNLEQGYKFSSFNPI